MTQPAATSPTLRPGRAAGRIPYSYRFLVSLPEGYRRNGRRRWPIVFFFHGRGERGSDLSLVAVHGLPKQLAAGRRLPCIVVAPQCPLEEFWWNYGTLDAFVAERIRHYRADPDRVYLTGLSMGGFATWALAQSAPERYAAIAPVCGGGDVRFAERLVKLPLWAFHGAKDLVVPVDRTREMIRRIRAVGGHPRMTIYPQAGHDSWTATYENPKFLTWLLGQRRARG